MGLDGIRWRTASWCQAPCTSRRFRQKEGAAHSACHRTIKTPGSTCRAVTTVLRRPGSRAGSDCDTNRSKGVFRVCKSASVLLGTKTAWRKGAGWTRYLMPVLHTAIVRVCPRERAQSAAILYVRSDGFSAASYVSSSACRQ
eukprot:5413868-Pyramimonas_sp.AAC.3